MFGSRNLGCKAYLQSLGDRCIGENIQAQEKRECAGAFSSSCEKKYKTEVLHNTYYVNERGYFH